VVHKEASSHGGKHSAVGGTATIISSPVYRQLTAHSSQDHQPNTPGKNSCLPYTIRGGDKVSDTHATMVSTEQGKEGHNQLDSLVVGDNNGLIAAAASPRHLVEGKGNDKNIDYDVVAAPLVVSDGEDHQNHDDHRDGEAQFVNGIFMNGGDQQHRNFITGGDDNGEEEGGIVDVVSTPIGRWKTLYKYHCIYLPAVRTCGGRQRQRNESHFSSFVVFESTFRFLSSATVLTVCTCLTPPAVQPNNKRCSSCPPS